MAATRKSRVIKDPKDIEFFLSLKEEDITTSFIMENFGEFNGKSKFNPYDIIEIPAGSYGKEGKKNKEKFTTTVGLWVYNIYFIQNDLFDMFGYINNTVNKKQYSKMEKAISYAVMEDKISLDVYKRYEMKVQKCMPYINILSPSFTMEMLASTKKIEAKKKELYKKYKEGIEARDEIAITEMEEELKAYAREILKDDPSMDMFDSGARGSFNNHFKNMFIMKGMTKDPDPNKGYNVILSSYMNGVSKEEYSMLANSLAEGPYFRSKKTEVGGHWEKLFYSATQHIVLLPPGSDCGTKRYIEVNVTKDNIDMLMYCYVIEGSRLVEITSENKDKYVGKKIKVRYSAMCESKDGICNKCAGNLFYRLGITNIGVATPQLASKLKLGAMKGFHDSQVKLAEMDVEKAFGY